MEPVKDRQYLINLFQMMNAKNQGPLYAEGGPLRPDNNQGNIHLY